MRICVELIVSVAGACATTAQPADTFRSGRGSIEFAPSLLPLVTPGHQCDGALWEREPRWWPGRLLFLVNGAGCNSWAR